ncbi:hypothetical protein K435DRAFT_780004 [Dendrothele bispora CBS 962.96]|uniref:PAS domain-containing protein n=1 Tax=Dendrothele bispora (strain CBS 962.96) TaxID=1314807 RepID=A0A4S8LTW7_DENBC|nr:hypothetical protein K435DRAFT_780004 [Dendrothele bispora CBS 962.96]
MPFERYLENSDYNREYDYNNSNNNNVNNSTHDSASSTSRSFPGGGQVRIQIPQFISTGAPMLAPGGGAEILPAGLFSGGASSSWFANNGLTSSDFPQSMSFPSSSSKTYIPQQSTLSSSNPPVPIHYIHHASDAVTPTSATATSLPFDFGDSSSSAEPKDPSRHPPGMYVNQGIAPSLYSSQLNAIAPSAASPMLSTTSLPSSSFGVSVPSPLGLPVYSTTGFDLLSVLARVATRPNPQVALGPVDLTSSFAVVDVRRFDHPIIYCSPTFCRLTGYEEHEILGRNCRFLQSPDGNQPKGEIRKFTSHEAVSHIKKHLAADKEVQTSIVNYRKNGEAFINLVTIIPIRGGDIGMPSEDDKVVYHVGFQVDLNTQPHDIMQKVKDGSYIPNYIANDPVAIVPPVAGGPALGGMHALVSRDRKLHAIPPPAISKQFKKLLEDRNFMATFPITTNANSDSPNAAQTNATSAASATSPTSSTVSNPLDVMSPTLSSSGTGSSSELMNVGPMANHPLSLLLLEYSPDFIHVVSLKGSFLYVAPSVQRILGYRPVELIGRSLSDICHPADVIPLMRELKESSATGPTALGGGGTAGVASGDDPKFYTNKPRPVDLLFRARTKDGKYVWVECRGRLHVEPGKGRKAIMLSGRAKEMSNLKWSAVASTGGMSRPRLVMGRSGNAEGGGAAGSGSVNSGSAPSSSSSSPGIHEKVTEFWGTITRNGVLLVVGSGCKDVLGWDELELIGRPIWNFLIDDDKKRRVGEELGNMGCAMGSADAPGSLPSKLQCRMFQHNRTSVNVELVLYPSSVDSEILASSHKISPAPIIYQIKLFDSSMTTAGTSKLVHPLEENIFKELETGRGTSWQYELQQLKFANDRLRDEIKNLEGENGVAASSNQLLALQQLQQQKETSGNTGVMKQQTQTPQQHLPLTVTVPMGGNYDHQQHHPGLGSGSLISADHSSITSAASSSSPSSHTGLYGSRAYGQPTEHWSTPLTPNVNVNPMPGVPTSVSVPMQYVSPQQQSQMMRFGNSPAGSSQLKRTWDSVNRGGPA